MIVVGITGWDVAFAGIATTVWSGPAGLGRTGGTVGPPNAAAGYLGVLLPAAAAVLLTRLGRGQKILAAAALGLGLLALLFTFSRGGWIACAVALAGLGGLAWWRGWIKLPVVLLLAAGAGLVLVLAQDLIVARWLTNDPTAGRVPLLQMAGRIIADHPLLGVGANNFSVVLPHYVTPEFSGDWIYIVHNKYLLVLAEAGLGGLLAFLWFLAATVRQAWQRGRLADPLLGPLAWGLAAALTGRLIHMNMDTFKDRPSTQLLWVVAALVAALTGIGVPQAQEERTGRP
jgi:O-antigen ligase